MADPLHCMAYGVWCMVYVQRGADLRQSLFIGANFIRADIEESIIEGADFTDALLDKYQLGGLCAVASGRNEATGVLTAESLHCDTVRERAYSVRVLLFAHAILSE